MTQKGLCLVNYTVKVKITEINLAIASLKIHCVDSEKKKIHLKNTIYCGG